MGYPSQNTRRQPRQHIPSLSSDEQTLIPSHIHKHRSRQATIEGTTTTTLTSSSSNTHEEGVGTRQNRFLRIKPPQQKNEKVSHHTGNNISTRVLTRPGIWQDSKSIPNYTQPATAVLKPNTLSTPDPTPTVRFRGEYYACQPQTDKTPFRYFNNNLDSIRGAAEAEYYEHANEYGTYTRRSMIRTVNEEDYLYGRGANPRTGLVTPGFPSRAEYFDSDCEKYSSNQEPSASRWRTRGNEWISLNPGQLSPTHSPEQLDTRRRKGRHRPTGRPSGHVVRQADKPSENLLDGHGNQKGHIQHYDPSNLLPKGLNIRSRHPANVRSQESEASSPQRTPVVDPDSTYCIRRKPVGYPADEQVTPHTRWTERLGPDADKTSGPISNGTRSCSAPVRTRFRRDAVVNEITDTPRSIAPQNITRIYQVRGGKDESFLETRPQKLKPPLSTPQLVKDLVSKDYEKTLPPCPPTNDGQSQFTFRHLQHQTGNSTVRSTSAILPEPNSKHHLSDTRMFSTMQSARMGLKQSNQARRMLSLTDIPVYDNPPQMLQSRNVNEVELKGGQIISMSKHQHQQKQLYHHNNQESNVTSMNTITSIPSSLAVEHAHHSFGCGQGQSNIVAGTMSQREPLRQEGYSQSLASNPTTLRTKQPPQYHKGQSRVKARTGSEQIHHGVKTLMPQGSRTSQAHPVGSALVNPLLTENSHNVQNARDKEQATIGQPKLDAGQPGTRNKRRHHRNGRQHPSLSGATHTQEGQGTLDNDRGLKSAKDYRAISPELWSEFEASILQQDRSIEQEKQLHVSHPTDHSNCCQECCIKEDCHEGCLGHTRSSSDGPPSLTYSSASLECPLLTSPEVGALSDTSERVGRGRLASVASAIKNSWISRNSAARKVKNVRPKTLGRPKLPSEANRKSYTRNRPIAPTLPTSTNNLSDGSVAVGTATRATATKKQLDIFSDLGSPNFDGIEQTSNPANFRKKPNGPNHRVGRPDGVQCRETPDQGQCRMALATTSCDDASSTDDCSNVSVVIADRSNLPRLYLSTITTALSKVWTVCVCIQQWIQDHPEAQQVVWHGLQRGIEMSQMLFKTASRLQALAFDYAISGTWTLSPTESVGDLMVDSAKSVLYLIILLVVSLLVARVMGMVIRCLRVVLVTVRVLGWILRKCAGQGIWF